MKKAELDLARLRCQWEANGQQCGNLGTVSHSTLGGGPWYCWAHFNCHDGAAGVQIVEESLGRFKRLAEPPKRLPGLRVIRNDEQEEA